MIKEKNLKVAVKKTEEAMDDIVRQGGQIISNQHMVIGELFMFIITYKQ
jgi:hypothetical protein